MADESIENTTIEGLQGSELMGRPLRINKAEPRGSGGPRRGGRSGYGSGNYSGGYGNNNSNGYGNNNSNGYGNNNASSYGGNYSGGYSSNNSSSYGGNYSEPNSNSNKPSGAEGWEDRSYGNASENSEFESGRSRRKRGVSSESDIDKE